MKEPEKRLKHHLFDSDEFEETLIAAVWFDRNIPKRRK
jgi:hypothetical protein